MKKILWLALLISGSLSAQTVDFNLKAKVFDDGQKITAIELNTQHIPFKRNKLNAKAFEIHAQGTLPFDPKNAPVFGQANGERKVQKAFVNQQGNIELQLVNDKQANTLAYVAGDIGRNVEQDLRYQITLKQPSLFNEEIQFQQAKIIDNEVARFTPKTSQSGLNYQFFAPNLQKIGEKRPLVIWLHGNGEGGVGDYQNNRSPLLANRGGVAFTTPESQRIFGGAYVVVPQVPDTWYFNYQKGYLAKLHSLIEQVVAENAIDRQRIYLFGASAGGYMSLRMLLEYPDLFAAVNVSAPALDKAAVAGGVATTAEELQKIQGKPLWLVHATNDATISYTATSKRVFQQLREHGAILSLYPEVKTPDGSYNGHWSWIYSLRNEPVNPQGERLFQWVAKQRLAK